MHKRTRCAAGGHPLGGEPTVHILLAAAHVVRSSPGQGHAHHADAHRHHHDGGYQRHHEVQVEPLGHPGGQADSRVHVPVARAVVQGRDGSFWPLSGSRDIQTRFAHATLKEWGHGVRDNNNRQFEQIVHGKSASVGCIRCVCSRCGCFQREIERNRKENEFLN